MGTVSDDWDEERSVIGDKGDIGFIDYADDKSMCGYNTRDDGGPVSISVPFPLKSGKPRSGFVGETIVDTIMIENNTDETIQLWSISIYNSKPEDSFTLSLMEPPNDKSDEEYRSEFLESFSLEDRILRPGRPLTVWLSCKPKSIGMHTSAVHFSVGDESFERLAFLLAEDKISHSLASNKPFQRRSKKKDWVIDNFSSDAFVSGKRPSRSNANYFKNRLPNYPIPKGIREMIENKHTPDDILEGLTKMNYASYFKTLVIMEEIKLEEDMRGFDMERVCMKSKWPEFLMLEVPGLAEKRPSLVRGDYILAKPAVQDSNEKSPAYQGYIHRVEAEEVYLKFDKEIHYNHKPSTLYNVQFTYNRTNMRRLYQAIEATQGLEMQLLFPSESNKKRFINPSPLVPISSRINEQQMRSVEMILGCKGGAPYVIHGPPGTGKTMTLGEAILQLYINRKNTRILVCAPSNSAADHILEKLLGGEILDAAQKKEIFRLNALTRPIEDINPDYMEFCNVEHGEMIFKCPPYNVLKRYRIVISTYASASLIYSEGIKTGHFSHIFLDEAGQASEPETMVPLSNLYTPNTVVVLAGDPMQLGPVIFSKDAEAYGLGQSYLERLFKSKYYETGDENYVTKLVQNYRCHFEILHLPSELFYKGELIACKDDSTSPKDWTDLLPNKDFPVLFIGIQGCDEREGNNPSWFNRTEASKVVENINTLIEKKGFTEDDIGVIAPYRQQVLKIKKALESVGLEDLKVGSVEQFQGQEREVIIISTVRSTVKHNEFDKNFCLGFLSNQRRFNVAITRAKSLLIIVGNPHIICQDKHWNMLLWRCHDNGSYQGCCLPERQEVFDENDGYGQGEAYGNYDGVPHSGRGEWGQDSSNKGEWGPGGEWGRDSSNKGEWGPGGEWGRDSSNKGKWGPGGEWGQDSSNKGEWGQDSSNQGEWSQGGEWGQNSSKNGEWDQGGDWGQDSSNQGEWSQGGEWDQDSANQGGEWGQDSASQGVRSKGKEWERDSSKKKTEWGQDSSTSRGRGQESSYQDVDWSKLSFEPGEIPKAVIDPDQFSDGWK